MASPTLLLVEDNPEDVRWIRDLLAEAGMPWRVEHSPRLVGAEARLAQGGVDAVLLDLGLPDAAGRGVVDGLRASFPELPVVVLMGCDDDPKATESLGTTQDYLVKGRLDAQSLSQSIRHAVASKRLEEELRQAQRLEALGRFAGSIAHDFNNLLGVIIGFTELLLHDGVFQGRARERLEQVHKAGERAAALTRQLLAYSRKQAWAPQELDLGEVVDSLSAMLVRLVGEHIALERRLERGIVIKADRGQIELALMNLVANARDSMSNGGVLSVIVEASGGGFREVPAGRYGVLVVRDTGRGMDAATRGRMFEPFFTTKEVGKGTGLGLATVAGILAQSAGHIDVESEPGVGTTFRLFLPLVARSVAERGAEPGGGPGSGAERGD